MRLLMLMLLSRVSSSSSLRLFHSSSSSQQRQVAWVSSSSSDHHRLRRLLQHRTHTVFVGSGKLAAEDFVPSPFVAYNFHHSSSIMTAGTNRRSMRLASSSSSNPSNPKNKEGSSTNKKVPVVAAKTKNQQKKNPMKEPSTTTKSKSSTVTIPSSPSKKDIPNDNHPWYRIFTKGDEEYDRYMATEWGFEKHGTVPLFEKMSLEGAQSGLSWLTILRKRDAYRRVFYHFDIDKVAAMTESDIIRILAEEDKIHPHTIIVRHRGKIESVINNARCIQALQKKHPEDPDYLDSFLWSFVDNRPILNMKWHGESLHHALGQTKESQAMSKALKKEGFRFVGPTTMYAMMQSCGMVIDHPVNSPEWLTSKKYLEQERLGGFQEQEKNPHKKQQSSGSPFPPCPLALPRNNSVDARRKVRRKCFSHFHGDCNVTCHMSISSTVYTGSC